MTSAVLASEAAQAVPPLDGDCWIPGAQAASLSIQCQPLAARSDNDIMWPATIRDISAERIALVLQRRFEPQTGLSLSLPEPGSDSMSGQIARVIRVEPLADRRWLLDCAFAAPITEERLDAILQAAKAPPRELLSTQPSEILIEKAIVTSVIFQVRYGNRDSIRRAITRLHVNGRWPLTTGRAMKVWVGGGPRNETVADVRVNGCYKQGGSWLIDCFFLGAPPAILLEKLRTGMM
jgi:hypothetical protein